MNNCDLNKANLRGILQMIPRNMEMFHYDILYITNVKKINKQIIKVVDRRNLPLLEKRAKFFLYRNV